MTLWVKLSIYGPVLLNRSEIHQQSSIKARTQIPYERNIVIYTKSTFQSSKNVS